MVLKALQKYMDDQAYTLVFQLASRDKSNDWVGDMPND